MLRLDEEQNRGPKKEEKKKEVNNKKYYELLGVDQKAVPTDIKRAFRKLSLTKHPDKGGDAEEVDIFRNNW